MRLPRIGLPKGITLRITLVGWLVTLVTLGVFVVVLVPDQKREFEIGLDSKARGIAVSIRGVAAGAAVSEDYSAVVDQAMQVLAGDKAIDYVVMTKNDGFSIAPRETNRSEFDRLLVPLRTARLPIRLSVRLQRHSMGLDSYRIVTGFVRR